MFNAMSPSATRKHKPQVRIARLARRGVGVLILVAGTALGLLRVSSAAVRISADAPVANAASVRVDMTLATAFTSIGSSR
jgi:hypothetical protein